MADLGTPGPVGERGVQDDPVMAAVASSWQSILDADAFDPDRRLIDTGADSLRIMRFVLQLEQLLDRKIAFDLLSPDTTPRSLAAGLRGVGGGSSALPRVFYLSGLNGTDYRMVGQLREALGEAMTFSHADAPGLDQPPALLRDLAATADWIAASIIAAQPEGKVCLAGYSIGGIQAFEVARQLVARGREVAFLCLFDAMPRRTLLRVVTDTLRKPLLLPGKLRNRMPSLQRTERKVAEQNMLVDLALKLGAYGLASKAARLTSRSAGADESDIFRLWHWRLLAIRRWQPRPLAIRAMLVVTDDGARLGAQAFWRKWIEGLTIVEVPGTHDALSKAPVPDNVRRALLALVEHAR